MLQRCTSCGAAVEVGPEVLSTTCRFCDSPLVAADRAAEVVDGVVPFVVPEAGAADAIARWVQHQWLAPAAVRRAGRPRELRAVLVPVYAHDATCRSQWTADVGIHWMRTETYVTTENGKTVTRTRQVQETEWFGTAGTHAVAWTDHLVSASQGLSEEEANALEPFDLGRAVAFTPEGVAGLPAEQPTRSHGDVAQVAQTELLQRARAAVAALLPGDRSRGLQLTTEVQVQATRLVLVPVWVAVLHGGEQAVRLLVNGQTGEVVGHVPASWGKVLVLVLAVLGVLVAVLGFAVWLQGGLG